MKKTSWLLSLVVILALLWLYGRSESYCYLWPSIDTEFAPSFTETKFQIVKPGMSQDDVLNILGEPLDVVSVDANINQWFYSRDGRSRFFDMAWLGRYVEFENGMVREVVSRIYYD